MQATGWVLFTLAVVWIVPPVICFLWRVMRPATVDESHPRRVSVVVAACNEEAGIEATIRTLLDSVGVDIEVIPVNDRSTDQTGAIIDRMAATDSRVKPVHIKELPPGWLGKTHAMHVGAQRATSDALLFTDGDIKFDPRALHQACAYLEQHELDHLCLLPQLVPGGVLENACLSYFGFAYAVGLQLHLIRTGWPLSYAGVGAFNLVRTQFYREIGGHEQIAMDVLDDVKLGKMIRRAGGRLDFRRAPELVSVRWQQSLRGLILGLEKNAFASLNYSVRSVIVAMTVSLMAIFGPYLAIALLPWPESAGFLGTVLIWHAGYGAIAGLIPYGWMLTPLFPVAAGIMSWTWIRSAWVTLRQGGVRWRESFYSLKELREKVYR